MQDLGLFLDLNEVQSPQPIRGSNGGTDPGPRKDAASRTQRRLLIQSQVT